MTEEKFEMVESETNNGEVLDAQDVFEKGTTALVSSDKSNDFISKAENVNIFGEQADGLKDATNLDLEIVKYVAGNVELVDNETGEVRPALRVVLLTKDGKRYSTESKSAIRQLGQMVQLMKQGGLHMSKETPMPVKVIMNKTRNGYQSLGFKLNTAKLKSYLKK